MQNKIKYKNFEIELTVLIPCLNEAETLAICIHKAQNFLKAYGVSGEIVVADNGSTDGSQQIALTKGARVVPVPFRGYGAALIKGIKEARGKYIIMGDADDSYDFTALEPFLNRLRDGADIVMGNRFKGGIAPGAMPFLHRYLGNPVLSWIGRLFFNIPTGDFHCGLRGFSRDRILELNLRTTGMEFASEMIVRASFSKYRIDEVPTTTYLARWLEASKFHADVQPALVFFLSRHFLSYFWHRRGHSSVSGCQGNWWYNF